MLQMSLWKSLTPSLSTDSQAAHPARVPTEAGGDSDLSLVDTLTLSCHRAVPAGAGAAGIWGLPGAAVPGSAGRVRLEGALCGESLSVPPLHKCLNWLEHFALSPPFLDLSPSFPQEPRRLQH